MQLIGVLDSPYVRRVAISLQLLGIPFEHKPLSVFSGFDKFAAINPVVKAPTLITDDGVTLMDSGLILLYAESLGGSGRSLWPSAPAQRARVLEVEGLALAVCEKSVQIVYESRLRPADKVHEPWLERITAQLGSACAMLEAVFQRMPPAVDVASIDQAGISAAVAWHFTTQSLPGLLDEKDFPALQAHSARAELLWAFKAAPHSFTAVVVS